MRGHAKQTLITRYLVHTKSNTKLKGTKFVSLADYCAMGNSEVSMREGAAVELMKVGCAGWWFVRVLGKCSLLLSQFFTESF